MYMTISPRFLFNNAIRLCVMVVLWLTAFGVGGVISKAGTISGIVSDDSGTNRLAGILVEVYRVFSGWQFVNNATTDTNGYYQISFTGQTNYVVRFSDPADLYLDQFYNHASRFETASNIFVSTLGSVTNINAQMNAVSSISGMVFGPDNATPQPGINVAAYKMNDFFEWEEAENSITDVNGSYLLTGLAPNNYRVMFRDFTGDLLTEWYLDADSINDASDVVVPLSSTVSGINVAMAYASRISGTVLDLSNDLPLENISVTAYQWDGAAWVSSGSSSTDPDGNYVIGGLRTGTYRIEFLDGNATYVTIYYFNVLHIDAAVDVGVDEAALVSGIDAAMFPYATIGGLVTGTNLMPLANVEVSAIKWNGFDWEIVSIGYTSEAGEYSVGSLAPGSFRIRFDGNFNYGFPLWYYIQTLDINAAADIFVDAGSSVTGINIQIYLPTPNQSPTNILLSAATVMENMPTGTVVGTFTTEDPDEGNTFSYELVIGSGGDDNGLFDLDGNQLKTASSLNYESHTNRYVRVKSTDQGGLSVESEFVIFIFDVDEVPVLTGLERNQSNEVIISWSSLSNQQFAVRVSTNLNAGFTLLAEEVPASPPVNGYTATVSSAGLIVLQVTTED